MYCSTARPLLQQYVDRHLSLEKMRALELHLSVCHACGQEFHVLQRIEQYLREVESIVEPSDLAVNIMRRVASTQQIESSRFVLLRPSLAEIAAAALLATIATLGVMLGLPSLRDALPLASSHNMLSLLLLNVAHALMMMNSQTLMLSFWIIGTILGIWITLALAGNEMRRMEWFRSVKDRLPVW